MDIEKLLSLLSAVRGDINFQEEKNIMEDGLLDSVDVLTILTKIEEEFGVVISILDMNPEDFNSLESIYNLIMKNKNI